MKKNRKCIAIFSAFIPPHVGGIERYVDNLSRKLVDKGYQVIIVTSDLESSDNVINVNNKIIILKLPIYNIFKNRYPIYKKRKAYKIVYRELSSYTIDAIIVNTRFHLISHIGAKYGKKNDIPVYLIEHGSNYVTLDNKFIDFFANRYEDLLTYKLKNKISGFYGVSDVASNWLKKFKIKASGTWYNSIDTNQKLKKKEKHDGINYMYAGRLINQKGVENILIAFIQLQKKYNNIHLYIAGSGSEFNRYKDVYNSCEITFLGKLTYEELKTYYVKTDVFIYPPLWPEGLPSSILEAGLNKCAVITTDQGGITEIVDDGENGLIVDGTSDSIEYAMEKLLNNRKFLNKMSSKLYKTVNEKFSWDATVDKILFDIFKDEKGDK